MMISEKGRIADQQWIYKQCQICFKLKFYMSFGKEDLPTCYADSDLLNLS